VGWHRRRAGRGADVVITVIGLDVDPVVVRFLEAAVEAGDEVRFVNLRAAVRGRWHLSVPPSASPAVLCYAGRRDELDPDGSYYCRLTDLSSKVADRAERRQWRALIPALDLWLRAVPGLVVNRPDAGSDNSSKPLHEATLAGFGFKVPDSITTSSPRRIHEFVAAGPTISKTVCGVRASAALVTTADIEGFRPEQGPIHLQRQVPGADARLHVVGESVVAQRLETAAADYRRSGDFENLATFDPPASIASLVVSATKAIGLEFAGWDFRIGDDDTYWCLEVNPMPGYSPYDYRCDGAISRLLLDHLSQRKAVPL
jgi:hypothetical protein